MKTGKGLARARATLCASCIKRNGSEPNEETKSDKSNKKSSDDDFDDIRNDGDDDGDDVIVLDKASMEEYQWSGHSMGSLTSSSSSHSPFGSHRIPSYTELMNEALGNTDEISALQWDTYEGETSDALSNMEMTSFASASAGDGLRWPCTKVSPILSLRPPTSSTVSSPVLSSPLMSTATTALDFSSSHDNSPWNFPTAPRCSSGRILSSSEEESKVDVPPRGGSVTYIEHTSIDDSRCSAIGIDIDYDGNDFQLIHLAD